jgi:RNA polymerase sigma factor (sigma-70 family)
VHIVNRGDGLLDPAITRSVIEEFAGKPSTRRELAAKLDELTDREREVFRLVARGLSNAEIAAELVVSEGTVKTHVARVLLKLGLRDRVQAVVYAYESGEAQAGY